MEKYWAKKEYTQNTTEILNKHERPFPTTKGIYTSVELSCLALILVEPGRFDIPQI